MTVKGAFAQVCCVRRIWIALNDTIVFADGLLVASGMTFDDALSLTFTMFEFRDGSFR